MAVILVILALICAVLAALNVNPTPRVNMIGLALAFYFASLLVGPLFAPHLPL
jgi:hypothetical protein